MSRHGKIDWTRLWKSFKETTLVGLIGIIMVFFVTLPVILSIFTGSMWWVLLYLVAFLIVGTWEKYNGR